MTFRKYILSFFLSFAFFGLYAEGIDSTKEFLEFVAACNEGKGISQWSNDEGIVVLNTDIDLAKAKKFPSIKAFGGVFDGQGHAILNWKAQRGLFGEVLEGGKIMNLRIDATCEMRSTTKSDGGAVGFIADVNSGIIENCENSGKIQHKSGASDKEVCVGGIAGINNFAILKCRNNGAITSQAASSIQENEIGISIGGIAGRAGTSRNNGLVMAWCENTGDIVYSGDFVICRVAGIVGLGNRMAVKYCVNRGKVDATSQPAEVLNPKAALSHLTGGIIAHTKGHVMCCDNFGAVISSGKYATFTGGICAMPHAAIVVGDCVNYGPVKVFNEANRSCVGGVVGSCSRPVHVKGCINRGDVSFEGMSSKRRSNVGGIAGQFFTKNDAVEPGHIRDCVNYGNIYGGAGGNYYMNNDNAIHTGGIVGWVAGAGRHKVVLEGCSNFGRIKAESGRKGDIYANAVEVVSGGRYNELWAESAEPMSDGSNIFGRVTSPDGRPIAGVVVSDGTQCVSTDGYGYYSMKADMDAVKFVYVSLPAYYEVPVIDGVTYMFRRVGRYEKAVMADFVLKPLAEQDDKYTVLMVADPQMRQYGVDGSAEAYRDVITPDMEQLRASLSGNCYVINLGDLVYNNLHAYDDYMDISAQVKAPTFNVIGNHDYDQNTLFDSSLGTMFFETYVGPENYSFNIGKLHYVVLNDIVYSRGSTGERYRSGLEDKTLRWLEDDLKYVPESSTIVLCMHSQMFKKKTSHSTRNVNYDNYLNLLKKYRQVYSWAGHNHDNYSYNYKGKGLDRDNIYSILVARTTGALRLNKYIGADGTPQGYVVLNVDGENLDWYYKAVGRGQDYQMKVYPPLKTDGRHIVANIWNYGDGWGKAEWWENGVKVCDMEQFEAKDPDYETVFSGVTNETTRKYCEPLLSPNMFRVMPSENATSGEVRVTDVFGNTYRSSITW